ncbi:MAG: alpha/beta fold hydrolase [Pseudomonadota bacterium]
MDTAMTFDREAAVAALQPWSWQQPAAPAGALADYARFYGLDRVSSAAVAAPATVRHGIGYLDAAGYRIVLQCWRRPAPRGTVLVLHGYYDHTGIFDHIIGAVLASGFDVLAYDLPGHGLSSGEPAAINDFVEYQTVLRAVVDGMSSWARPMYVVAQSTGGAIFMEYLLAGRQDRVRAPFAGAVLLAPLVRPVNWKVNSRIHRVVSLFRKTIARKFAVNSHDEEFLAFLRNGDPLQSRVLSVRWVGALKRWIPRMEAHAPIDYPLVVVQGDEDGTVDWRHNLGVIREKFPGVTVHMIEHGRHQLVNESEAIRAQVMARVAALLESAAS